MPDYDEPEPPKPLHDDDEFLLIEEKPSGPDTERIDRQAILDAIAEAMEGD